MMKTLMECEYEFYLRYKQRIPTVQSSASVFGTCIHEAVQKGYEEKLERDDWVTAFKQAWRRITSTEDIVYYSTKDYNKRVTTGTQMMLDYYDTFVLNTPEPRHVELAFGKDLSVEIEGMEFIGILDQVSADGLVIDMKTGQKPNQDELDCDLQFTLYSYVYRKLFGEKETGLVLRHLNTMKDMYTERTEKDFDILKTEISKITKKMNQKVFLRNLSRDCSKCFFLQACLGKERKFGSY